MPCAAARSREWRARNPELKKEQKKRWLIKRLLREPGYANLRNRIKRLNNPETTKAAWKRRYEWLKLGTVTKEELIRIWERDSGSCQYCNSQVKNPRFRPCDPRGFDHVISRSNGGKHEALNMVVCCQKCNALKQ
jgi:5-methylcytosine-specific restriction endonuclease McrA